MNNSKMMLMVVAALVLVGGGVYLLNQDDAGNESNGGALSSDAADNTPSETTPANTDPRPKEEPDPKANEDANSAEDTNEQPENTQPEEVDTFDNEDVEQLIALHTQYFNSGNLRSLGPIEKKLREKAQPARDFPAFVAALMSDGKFAWRNRFLPLLDERSYDSLWAIFEKEQDRFRKLKSSRDWQEGEISFLQSLMSLSVQAAAKDEIRRNQLISLARDSDIRDFHNPMIAGIGMLEGEEGKPYVTLLRSFVIDGKTIEENRFPAAVELLKLLDSMAEIEEVLNLESMKDQKGDLIAIAMDARPGDTEVLSQLAERLILSGDRSGANALFALREVDKEASLRLARGILDKAEVSDDLKHIAIEILSELGSDAERQRILEIANGEGELAMTAALTLARQEDIGDVEQLYLSLKSPLAKTAVLSHAIHRPDGERVLERALAADQPKTLRIAAINLLEPTIAKHRTRLKDLASADKDPAAREKALRKLGDSGDISLMEFFQDRAASETQEALKTLAKQYADLFEQKKLANKKRASGG